MICGLFLVLFQYYYSNIRTRFKMITEKVHKTYYKIMFKEYTTEIQKKYLKN